jgi:hypothetical protein
LKPAALQPAACAGSHVDTYFAPGSLLLAMQATFVLHSIDPERVVCLEAYFLACKTLAETQGFQPESPGIIRGCALIELAPVFPLTFCVHLGAC